MKKDELIKLISDMLDDREVMKVAEKHSQLKDDHIYLSLTEDAILVNPEKIVSETASQKMFVVSDDEFYGVMYAIWTKLETEEERAIWEAPDKETNRDAKVLLKMLKKDELEYAYNNLTKLVIESM